jgi:hypothetical protein
VIRVLLGAVALLFLLVAGSTVTAGKGKKKRDPDARLYARKCGGACHRLYRPEEYTAPEWVEVVEKMAPRSKLTDEQVERITAYLVKHAREEEPGDPE